MAKTHLKVHMGGIATAVELYKQAPTPNLIILESRKEPRDMLASLQDLAEYCDPTTKVVVVGHYNEVGLDRELIRSGISEYVVVPISMADVVSVISTIFVDPDALISAAPGRTLHLPSPAPARSGPALRWRHSRI